MIKFNKKYRIFNKFFILTFLILMSILLFQAVIYGEVFSFSKNSNYFPVISFNNSPKMGLDDDLNIHKNSIFSRPILKSPNSINTVSIDGNINYNEWKDASHIHFTVYYGYEEHNSSLYIKNDGNYIYIALNLTNERYDDMDDFDFYFDINQNLIRDEGDINIGTYADFLNYEQKWDDVKYKWEYANLGSTIKCSFEGYHGKGNYLLELKIPFSSLKCSPGSYVWMIFEYTDYDRLFSYLDNSYHYPSSNWAYSCIIKTNSISKSDSNIPVIKNITRTPSNPNYADTIKILINIDEPSSNISIIKLYCIFNIDGFKSIKCFNPSIINETSYLFQFNKSSYENPYSSLYIYYKVFVMDKSGNSRLSSSDEFAIPIPRSDWQEFDIFYLYLVIIFITFITGIGIASYFLNKRNK